MTDPFREVRRWPARWPLSERVTYSTGNDGDGCRRGLYQFISPRFGFDREGWRWLGPIPYVLERNVTVSASGRERVELLIAMQPDGPINEQTWATEQQIKSGAWGANIGAAGSSRDRGINRYVLAAVRQLADHLTETGESR